MATTYSINTGASLTATDFTGDGTKITLTNPNYVVMTNASNQLTSVATLPTANGGTGVNLSSLSDGLLNTTSGTLSSIVYSQTATANSIAQRDANGVLVASMYQSDPNALAKTRYIAAYLSTSNNTPATLYSLSTSSTATPGQLATTYSIEALISLGDATGESSSGFYSFSCKAKNISGTVTVSNRVSLTKILDTGLSSTDVTVVVSSTNVNITVTGIAATNINWSGSFKITQVVY